MAKRKDLGKEFPSIIDRAYKDSKRHTKVADIMSTPVETIRIDASMEEVAQKMGDRHIGSLIVEEYGTPIGIVTERDLLTRVLGEQRELARTRVREVMSYPLQKICPTLEIRFAAQTMFRKKGRLAVYECGDLQGILTASDLIRSMPEAPETSLRVDDFMTKKVVTVSDGTTLARVTDRMGKERIGSVVITREGKPFGIFTERDLLTTFLAQKKPLTVKVGEAASSPLITAPAGISLHEAATLMAAKHIRRLPLLKKGEIVGIITARDLVEGYAK
jgi:signal-transduction protein with cAMP-binding, CBS, and nucleotidyltransferase domain